MSKTVSDGGLYGVKAPSPLVGSPGRPIGGWSQLEERTSERRIPSTVVKDYSTHGNNQHNSSFDENMAAHFHGILDQEWDAVAQSLPDTHSWPPWAHQMCETLVQCVVRHGAATKNSFWNLYDLQKHTNSQPGSLRDLQHVRDQLQAHLHKLESNYKDATLLAKLQSDNFNLQMDVTMSKTAWQAANQQLTAKTIELQHKEAECEALREQLEAVQHTQKEHATTQKVSSMQALLNELQKQLMDTQDECNALESRVRQLEAQLHAKDDRIRELEMSDGGSLTPLARASSYGSEGHNAATTTQRLTAVASALWGTSDPGSAHSHARHLQDLGPEVKEVIVRFIRRHENDQHKLQDENRKLHEQLAALRASVEQAAAGEPAAGGGDGRPKRVSDGSWHSEEDAGAFAASRRVGSAAGSSSAEELAGLQRSLEQACREAELLRGQLQEAEQQLAAVKCRAAMAEESVASAAKTRSEELEQAAARCAALEAQVSELTSQVAAAAGQVHAVQVLAQEAEHQKAAAKAVAEQLNAERSQLRKDLQALQQELGAQRGAAVSAANMAAELVSAQAHAQQLSAELDAARAGAEAAQAVERAAAEARESLLVELQRVQQELVAAEAAAADAVGLRMGEAAHIKRITDLEAEVCAATGTAAALQSQLDALRMSEAQSTTAHQDSDKRQADALAKAQAQVQATTRELEHTKKQLLKVQKDLAESRSETKVAQMETNAALLDKKAAESDKGKAQDELEKAHERIRRLEGAIRALRQAAEAEGLMLPGDLGSGPVPRSPGSSSSTSSPGIGQPGGPSRYDSLTQRLDQAHHDTDHLRSQLAAAEVRAQHAQQLQQDVERLRQELQQQAAALSAEVAGAQELRQHLQASQQHADELRSQLQASEQLSWELSVARAQLEQANGQLAEVQAKAAGAQAQCEGLHSRIQALEQQLQLQAEWVDDNPVGHKPEQHVVAAQANGSDMAATSELQQQLAAAQEEVEHMRQQIQQLQQAEADAHAANQELEQQRQQADAAAAAAAVVLMPSEANGNAGSFGASRMEDATGGSLPAQLLEAQSRCRALEGELGVVRERLAGMLSVQQAAAEARLQELLTSAAELADMPEEDQGAHDSEVLAVRALLGALQALQLCHTKDIRHAGRGAASSAAPSLSRCSLADIRMYQAQFEELLAGLMVDMQALRQQPDQQQQPGAAAANRLEGAVPRSRDGTQGGARTLGGASTVGGTTKMSSAGITLYDPAEGPFTDPGYNNSTGGAYMGQAGFMDTDGYDEMLPAHSDGGYYAMGGTMPTPVPSYKHGHSAGGQGRGNISSSFTSATDSSIAAASDDDQLLSGLGMYDIPPMASPPKFDLSFMDKDFRG